MALSFQAGAINVGGFMACHRFVTHTTGFATQFGAEFAQGHWLPALGMLSVPLFFLSGAMLSAFFIDHRISRGQNPAYTFMIGVIAALLFVIVSVSHLNFFGTFGEALDIRRDYFLLAILCLASGIQNAAVTSASGAVIRTTHLTGLTTDLGIGLVRFFSRRNESAAQKLELQATWIRLTLIGGFILGSTIGAFTFHSFGYDGFLLPALVSCSLFYLGARNSLQRRRST